MNRKEDVRVFLEYIYKGKEIGLKRKRDKFLNLKLYFDSLKKKSGSKFLGVTKKSNKWEARIKHKKIVNIIGKFFTEKEAALAYNKEALKIYGVNARLNRINDDL